MVSPDNLESIIVNLKNALKQGQQSLLNEEKDLATFENSKKSYKEQIFNSKMIFALGSAGTIYSLSQIPSNFYQNKDMGVGFVLGISVMGLGIGVLAWHLFRKKYQEMDTLLKKYHYQSQQIRELNLKLEEDLRQYGVVKKLH